MRAPAEIVAELRRRGLYELVELVAQKHNATVEDVTKPTGERDVTKAKHVVWARLVEHFDGNASAVARIWDVHHTSIAWAIQQQSPEIVSVELASFVSLRGSYSFGYGMHAGEHAFYVRDRVGGQLTWYTNRDPLTAYHLARDVFAHCCEQAGQPTFRSAAAGGGGVS